MDNYMYIIIFTLRQPIGWLKRYHPSIDYDYLFNQILWTNRGPLPFPLKILKGTRPIAGLKWNRHHHPFIGYVLYLFVSTTLMFLLGWCPHIPSVQSHQYYPWWSLFYSSTKFPHYFCVYIIYPLNANVQLWTLPNSGCLDLGIFFLWRYPRCLAGYCRSQGADFCT